VYVGRIICNGIRKQLRPGTGQKNIENEREPQMATADSKKGYYVFGNEESSGASGEG